MGDIAPSKMPSGVKKARRDNTDFTEYKKGGAVWDKPRPKGLGAPKKLSAGQMSVRARLKSAGVSFVRYSS